LERDPLCGVERLAAADPDRRRWNDAVKVGDHAGDRGVGNLAREWFDDGLKGGSRDGPFEPPAKRFEHEGVDDNQRPPSKRSDDRAEFIEDVRTLVVAVGRTENAHRVSELQIAADRPH
jgi:hypothetical protein